MKSQGVDFRSLTPFIGYAGASVLLFYSGVFAFIFAVPVQIAYSRYGKEKGLIVAGVTAGLVIVVHLLQAVRFEAAGTGVVRILFMDSLMPIGILAGLSLFNVARHYDWWVRLVGAAAVALLGAVPSLHLLRQAVIGEGPLAEQLTDMLSVLGINENPGQWIEMVQRIVFNTIGLGLLAAIAANWWIGRSFSRKGLAPAGILRQAEVPDEGVWVVIAGLALVILAWLRDVSLWIEMAGWNVLLIASFLFAIQGMGILQHLIVRRGAGPAAERWIVTGVLILMFLPGLNIIVSIGLPLFGMSEVWIDYKRGESYESNTEQ
jgi:hypothetical protein